MICVVENIILRSPNRGEHGSRILQMRGLPKL